MEAIILAGGKGTRLKAVVSDVPKPMALVKRAPFLTYLLRYLSNNGVTHIVISTGYLGNVIRDYYGTFFDGLRINYSHEDAPLGTGGAIMKALKLCKDNNVIVLNGDTYFEVDIKALYYHHTRKKADITMALKRMSNTDRYGTVEIAGHRVTAMHEKQRAESGYINGGVYCLRHGLLEDLECPKEFSFEAMMQGNIGNLHICGLVSSGNFIDIGVPEEYANAQELIPEWIKL